MSFQRIRSIEIDEGFLGGFQQELSGHLNCVIGSRGSGKTTLLEFLRYALQVPVEDSRSLEGLVKKNLKAGRIRVEVETPLGVFVVERQAKSAPKVFDAQGALIHSPPEGLLKTGAYVYSQSEIEAMASKPMDRLALALRQIPARAEESFATTLGIAAWLVLIALIAAHHALQRRPPGQGFASPFSCG